MLSDCLTQMQGSDSGQNLAVATMRQASLPAVLLGKTDSIINPRVVFPPCVPQ